MFWLNFCELCRLGNDAEYNFTLPNYGWIKTIVRDHFIFVDAIGKFYFMTRQFYSI